MNDIEVGTLEEQKINKPVDGKRSIVSLEAEKFQILQRVLSVIKDICNDADIQEGFIRQRDNTQSSIFEINLTDILGCTNIAISNLKLTLDLIKCFSKNQVTVVIDDETFSFSDQFSRLTFDKPFPEYLDNKFMTQDELNSSYPVISDDLIFKCQVSKLTSDRIKVISQGFNTNSLQFNFIGDKVSLTAKTQSGDKEATLLENITSEKIFEEPSYVRFPCLPFIIDHDNDINLEIYEFNGICAAKLSTKISNVNIITFSRSSIRPQESD